MLLQSKSAPPRERAEKGRAWGRCFAAACNGWITFIKCLGCRRCVKACECARCIASTSRMLRMQWTCHSASMCTMYSTASVACYSFLLLSSSSYISNSCSSSYLLFTPYTLIDPTYVPCAMQLNSNSYDEYVSALNTAGYAVIQVRIASPKSQNETLPQSETPK